MIRHITRLALRRLCELAVVLFFLSMLIFLLARVIPGDPARLALGPSATQEQVDALRHELGFDRPVLVQFAGYLSGVSRGDLGRSLVTSRPVAEDIREFLPATLELAVVAMMIVLGISIPLGALTAYFRGTVIDEGTRILSLVGVTVPGFVFAIGMQLLIARFMSGWPVTGRIDVGSSLSAGPTGLLLIDSLIQGNVRAFLSTLQHLALPSLALAMTGIGQMTRITRSAMIDNMRKDHVLTLRSFGVPQRTVVFRYLLKLSSTAPLTITGLVFASLIGNAFVVELIFSWGGLASYGLQAIFQKDLNAVIAVVLVSGCFFVLANLAIDILIGFVDPRLHLRERS